MPNIFEQINALSSELNALPPLTVQQRELLDKKIRLEFNYNSNHIEGNTLTYGETKLLLFFDIVKAGDNHTHREYEEMRASDLALALVEELAKDKERPLTESFIKNLNKVILVRPYWKEAETAEGQKTQRAILVGDYKKYPNSVRLQNGEIFHYAAPNDVPVLMGELISWFQNELKNKETHPVELAALLHYRFVRIHPFDDGNGRIARLLMNYVLLLHDLPPVIIKSIDKPRYLNALQMADAGNIEYFVEYIGEQLLWSLNLSIKAAKNENIEEEKDWKKDLHLLKQGLNNKEEIKIKKSDKVITGLINNTVKTFITKISEGLIEINELFLGTYISFESIAPGSFSDFLSFPLSQENVSLKYKDTMYFLLGFTDFKLNSMKPFSFQKRIDFKFDEYGYSVSLEDDKTSAITKLYHQDFTEEDVDVYVDKLGKSITNAIKEKIKG